MADHEPPGTLRSSKAIISVRAVSSVVKADAANQNLYRPKQLPLLRFIPFRLRLVDPSPRDDGSVALAAMHPSLDRLLLGPNFAMTERICPAWATNALYFEPSGSLVRGFRVRAAALSGGTTAVDFIESVRVMLVRAGLGRR